MAKNICTFLGIASIVFGVIMSQAFFTISGAGLVVISIVLLFKKK